MDPADDGLGVRVSLDDESAGKSANGHVAATSLRTLEPGATEDGETWLSIQKIAFRRITLLDERHAYSSE